MFPLHDAVDADAEFVIDSGHDLQLSREELAYKVAGGGIGVNHFTGELLFPMGVIVGSPEIGVLCLVNLQVLTKFNYCKSQSNNPHNLEP